MEVILKKWWNNEMDITLEDEFSPILLILADQEGQSPVSEYKEIAEIEKSISQSPAGSKWKITFERIE